MVLHVANCTRKRVRHILRRVPERERLIPREREIITALRRSALKVECRDEMIRLDLAPVAKMESQVDKEVFHTKGSQSA